MPQLLLVQPSPPPRQALPRCHAHQWAPAALERQGDWTWTWKWLKGAPILAISIEKLMIDLSGLRDSALVSDNPPIYFNGKFRTNNPMFGQSHGKERPASDVMMSFSQNIEKQVAENEGTAAEALSILKRADPQNYP